MDLHVSVMLNEAVDALDVRPGGVYIDGTLGRAGHSAEILKRAGAGATLLGIDRDAEALAQSRDRLAPFAEQARIVLVQGCHGDMAKLAQANGIQAASGVLLDLGVSSPQLDNAARGFSFRADGPLDMRMDVRSPVTARQLVAETPLEALTDMFRTYGEEPQAYRAAKAIVAARAHTPFTTTRQLADFIEKTLGRRGAHHPATRIFQALRMAVNDEMGELTRALEGGLSLLAPGGRFAVITFESLTDRAVKRFFAAHAGRLVSLQAGGTRWEGELPRVRLVARRVVTAGEEEVAANSRARSAKLRIAERMEV